MWWIAAAYAGVVVNEDVGLDEVVGWAQAAVVVELGTPAMIPVKIPIPGSPEKDCGTYDYGVWRVTVTEVVAAPSGLDLQPGAVINVYPGNTPELIRLSTTACVEGISKSPIFHRFDGAKVEDGATLLVLLQWEAPYGWVEAVAGSWVPPAKADAVRKKREAGLPRAVGSDEGKPEALLCVDDADCAKGSCREMRCVGKD